MADADSHNMSSKFFDAVVGPRRSPRHAASSVNGAPTVKSQNAPSPTPARLLLFDPELFPGRRRSRNITSSVIKKETLITRADSSSKKTVVAAGPSRKRSVLANPKDEILDVRPGRVSKAQVKIKRGFAPPEQYAHLRPLQDYLQEGLDVIFCGINPGERHHKKDLEGVQGSQ
ncbi:hypothetical protein B0H21DRAFT_748836 [Amylocystis lapponica]|nr:hypothetical protein B0H21DRAFT_748836 [Amylocystis lapponica]